MTEKSRKSYGELVDAIMDALPVRSDTTIQAISRKTGSSWETVWRWVELIIYIQGLPKVMRSKAPYGRGEVYRRERSEYGSTGRATRRPEAGG